MAHSALDESSSTAGRVNRREASTTLEEDPLSLVVGQKGNMVYTLT